MIKYLSSISLVIAMLGIIPPSFFGEDADINPFDAPIPGQSLTDKPGNYPWEHPPKYTDFMEASTFIWNRIHLKRNNKRLLQNYYS